MIFAAVVAVAAAAPQYGYGPPAEDSSEEVVVVKEVVPILRDERIHEEDGTFNLDVETGNGISFSQSGAPAGPDDAVIKSGQYS